MRLKRHANCIKELKFKTSRSGGKGGQHVNKVEAKVILYFNVIESLCLTTKEKDIILTKIGDKLVGGKYLQLIVSETRSQAKNKEIAINRFLSLLNKLLIVKNRRKPTKTPKSVKEKRLKLKRMKSEKKKLRKKDY